MPSCSMDRTAPAARSRNRLRSIEEEVAALLTILAPTPQEIELRTDQHKNYPRAVPRGTTHHLKYAA